MHSSSIVFWGSLGLLLVCLASCLVNQAQEIVANGPIILQWSGNIRGGIVHFPTASERAQVEQFFKDSALSDRPVVSRHSGAATTTAKIKMAVITLRSLNWYKPVNRLDAINPLPPPPPPPPTLLPPLAATSP